MSKPTDGGPAYPAPCREIRLKTNPAHKARFQHWVSISCSCGWISGQWRGTGSRASAANEWRKHRETCEQSERAFPGAKGTRT